MWPNPKKKRHWQTCFIKDIFKNEYSKEASFSKLSLNNIPLVNTKGVHLPTALYKFYAPTPQNIDDVKNKLLWLADPIKFNDPFDCKIGYDNEKYEKVIINQFYQEQILSTNMELSKQITENEIDRINKSKLGELESFDTKNETYYDAIYDIMHDKDEGFKTKLNEYIKKNKQEVDEKVDSLKKLNIRVTCFSNLDYISFDKQTSMWAHYADNHKGFCVRYDIEPLKDEITFKTGYSSFYSKDLKNEYLDERVKFIIKAGLFPVNYTSQRINVPVTMLKKLKNSSFEKLSNSISINELIFKTYITKSPVWSYETYFPHKTKHSFV